MKRGGEIARSAWELRCVETGRVRLDGGTQVRVDLYVDDVVQSYADAIEAGEELPPIDVVDDGDNLWLVDGYHRHAAHLRLRRAVISARVTRGTREDAQWLAAAANADHGLRRTNADKRAAVRLALANPRAAKLSISQIAKHCRVSRQLAEDVALGILAEQARGEPDLRLGADGRWRPARIGGCSPQPAILQVGGYSPQPAELQVGDLTPRNHTIANSEIGASRDQKTTIGNAARDASARSERRTIDASTADAEYVDDEWIPDDERAAVEEEQVAREETPAVSEATSAVRSRGEIAIEVLASRVADMRETLSALMRQSTALRAAITRAEADAPETVVPAQLATRWPLGDALHGVSLALDEIEPSGLCAACEGAGCTRCGGVGWTSVAAARADARRDEAVASRRRR